MEGIGVFVGVDVAKQHLDVAVSGQPPERYENNAQGIDELIAALRASQPRLVVMEASGGYHRTTRRAVGAEATARGDACGRA